ncbi:UNVERIFIED_CONTAM: hypothetical protein Sindi_2030600 [Sesamum indicum]
MVLREKLSVVVNVARLPTVLQMERPCVIHTNQATHNTDGTPPRRHPIGEYVVHHPHLCRSHDECVVRGIVIHPNTHMPQLQQLFDQRFQDHHNQELVLKTHADTMGEIVWCNDNERKTIWKGPAEHYMALLQNQDTFGLNAFKPWHRIDDTLTLPQSNVWHATSCVSSCPRKIQPLEMGSKRQVPKDRIRGLLAAWISPTKLAVLKIDIVLPIQHATMLTCIDLLNG